MTVSPLLSELIKASVSLKPPYAEDSRDARIMHLILDELAILPALPLSLPQPADPRLSPICLALQDEPSDASTVADWSARLGLDQTTIQRLFRKENRHDLRPVAPASAAIAGAGTHCGGAEDHRCGVELGYESPSAFTSMFKKAVWQNAESFFQVVLLAMRA